MDRDEFRHRAMFAAMTGLLASSKGWAGDDLAEELARRCIVFADTLVEANTIDKDEEK